MMAEISISGRLPSGDGNGLVAIAQQLIDQALGNVPREIHLCVALVDCAKVTVNADTHELVPTARVRRIEVISGEEDVAVLRNLMSRALDARTGREALPYNLEQELRGIFDDEGEQDEPATGAGSGLEQPPLDAGEPDEGPEGSGVLGLKAAATRYTSGMAPDGGAREGTSEDDSQA